MLDSLFKPKSVAVIGASTKELSIGNRVLKNLVDFGFKGPIYPINPKADEVRGIKAYKSILDAPDNIDVVHMVIPAKFVPQAVEDCGQKGVKNIMDLEIGRHFIRELLFSADIHASASASASEPDVVVERGSDWDKALAEEMEMIEERGGKVYAFEKYRRQQKGQKEEGVTPLPIKDMVKKAKKGDIITFKAPLVRENDKFYKIVLVDENEHLIQG